MVDKTPLAVSVRIEGLLALIRLRRGALAT